MKNKLTSPIFKEELLQMASNLNKASKGWVVDYDPETDSLSFSEKNLGEDTKINYLDQEIAVYISPDSQIRGVFIEYATKNYLSHNKKLDSFKKKLARISKEQKSNDFVRINKSDAETFIFAIQEEVKDFVLDNLTFSKSVAC